MKGTPSAVGDFLQVARRRRSAAARTRRRTGRRSGTAGCSSPASKPQSFMAGHLHAATFSLRAAWCSSAAWMKDLKSGWPPHGVDLNSGWNCTPMNHGCTLFGSSTISVSFSRWVMRRDHEAGLGQPVEVVLVGLVAVPMALGDDVAVDLVRQRARLDVGALCAQAHRCRRGRTGRCASASSRRGLPIRRSARSPDARPADRTRCCWRRRGRPCGARTRSSPPACRGRCPGRGSSSRARTGRRGSCPRRRACRSRRGRGSRRSAPRLRDVAWR